MQVANPLQMNDWKIKKFFRIILAIQLALWGLIGLDALGIQIPIARQLIGFIYLTFVPGFILLRILKLHQLGNIETILYTIGLSISILMFTGFFMNFFLPSVGISGPISIVPLVVVIGAVVLILCIICYIIDRNFQHSNFIDLSNVLSPSVLFLSLIPFLAIFGTYAVNFYHVTSILILMLILIPALAILIAFDMFISRKIFPFAVLLIAISLLFHNSLISMYVWGWDINLELYLASFVKMHSIWDPTIPSTCNGMLSLVMLAPIYSIISNLSITWVFKIIYPFLFSLVPLGLYRVFQKQTDSKIAFVSCLFFISFPVFYTEMLQLARQQIAELFIVLLILLMIDKDMDKPIRSALMIIFSVSLALSHYGLSYIFMLCLILAWIIFILAENPKIRKMMNNSFLNFGREDGDPALNPNCLKSEDRSINLAFVILFITFTLTWYMFVSDSSVFNMVVNIEKLIINRISSDFLDPDSVQGLKLSLGQSAPGLLHDLNKAMNYFNQIFIIIGGIVLLLRFKVTKFEFEYITFAELNLGLCFAGVTVPFFASAINMSRLYHITLIFLAPLCVIGGIAVIRGIIKLVGISWTDRLMSISIKILSIYFAIFLLYQSGIVFELTEGSSYSYSLNMTMDFPRFNDREVSGAVWLNNERGNNTMYADGNRILLLAGFEQDLLSRFPVDSSYIYLGTYNLKENFLESYSQMIYDRDKIYANGGSLVYYPRA